MSRILLSVTAVLCLPFVGWSFPRDERVPVIYTTDLFHPYGDPDDHYDLATLFALPELDVRAIVIDMPQYLDRVMQPGIPALRQMFELAGREVPHAIGMHEPLETPDDDARERADSQQKGVELILATLRASDEKVVIFCTGSLADVAAAYNREPALLRAKLRALYVNGGIGPDGIQEEYNVRCDQNAFLRVMTSELPLVWFPCFGREEYRSYFRVTDEAMISASPPKLQRFFVYALARSTDDPLAFLQGTTETLPTGFRNMWCTPAFLHAAGRKVYRTERGYEALRPADAGEREEAMPYLFHSIRLRAVEPRVANNTGGAAPGEPTAVFISDGSDRVGSRSSTPDGEPDCGVLITGLPDETPIESVTITGPRDGRWESLQSERWWRVFLDREGGTLRCAFRFHAAGEHQISIRMANGMERVATVQVTLPGAIELVAEQNVQPANVRVLRNAGALYGESMTSCLENLLADFPGR